MNEKSNSTPEKQPSFETALEQLQVSVKRLESGELSLEDSLRHFEEGVKLTRVCQDYLRTAEQRVEILMKGAASDQVELQPFTGGRSGTGKSD